MAHQANTNSKNLYLFQIAWNLSHTHTHRKKIGLFSAIRIEFNYYHFFFILVNISIHAVLFVCLARYSYSCHLFTFYFSIYNILSDFLFFWFLFVVTICDKYLRRYDIVMKMIYCIVMFVPPAHFWQPVIIRRPLNWAVSVLQFNYPAAGITWKQTVSVL